MGEQEEFTLRGYIQTLTRLSKPAFEEEGSKIEDWVGQGVGRDTSHITILRSVPSVPTRSPWQWGPSSVTTPPGPGRTRS